MNSLKFIFRLIERNKKKKFSNSISNIAIVSISLGIAIMLIAFMIFEGFRSTIQDKIFGLNPHIKIEKYGSSKFNKTNPISIDDLNIYDESSKMDGISHIGLYIEKAGLLKVKEDIWGVVFKGFSGGLRNSNFYNTIMEEESFENRDSLDLYEIIISRKIADKLNVDTNQSLVVFFVEEKLSVHKLTIRGIYSTGIEEFDEKIVLCNIQLLQKINKWDSMKVEYIGIYIDNFDEIGHMESIISDHIEPDLQVTTIIDEYFYLFNWFVILKGNTSILFIVILSIALFNVIAVLVIIMLDKIYVFGVFKALGCSNLRIMKLWFMIGKEFIYKSMIIGNLLALSFGYIQKYHKIISLDKSIYYIDSVPIRFEWLDIALLNTIIAISALLILFTSSIVVNSVSPIKSIKFT